MSEGSVAATLGIALLVFIFAMAWMDRSDSPLEAEAIQRGYALHCPQTGEFAWKGECDE